LQIPIEVAHVDHGWRTESEKDAAWVRNHVEALGVKCHIGQLQQPKSGNWEAEARMGRMRYLTQVCRKVGAQAILLGHHRRDQAETVLKTVLQGNALPHLTGMQAVGDWKGCPVWRPFLAVQKEEIDRFLSDQGVVALQDPSNKDLHYLRVRMREQLFPQLSKTFGKQIEEPLVRLGAEMQLLEGYLQEKSAPLMELVVEGPFGYYLPFVPGAHVLELRYLLRTLSPESLSVSVVDQVIALLTTKNANKRVEVGGMVIHLDRGRLFLQTSPFPERGQWNLLPDKGDVTEMDPIRGIWKGRLAVSLPTHYDGLISMPSNTCYRGSKSLSRWWNDHKIPHFLSSSLPVLIHENRVVQEFLTGRSPPHAKEMQHAILQIGSE
jgi:tRNA(Ile)-lysidine synthase